MKLATQATIDISNGGLSISWYNRQAGNWDSVFSFNDSGTLGGLGVGPKGVEYACAQLAAAINEALAIDRKLHKDATSAPLLQADGNLIEKTLAKLYLESTT